MKSQKGEEQFHLHLVALSSAGFPCWRQLGCFLPIIGEVWDFTLGACKKEVLHQMQKAAHQIVAVLA
jgi:hypothetical protein